MNQTVTPIDPTLPEAAEMPCAVDLTLVGYSSAAVRRSTTIRARLTNSHFIGVLLGF